MSESRLDIRCPKCGEILAPAAQELQAGMMIIAQPAACPKCGTCVLIPFPVQLGLSVTPKAFAEMVRLLTIIERNDGFGRLVVDFQRGLTSKVGLGEYLVDVR